MTSARSVLEHLGSLHQRGYRTVVGSSPLRETLAAATVLSSPVLRRLTVAAYSEEDLIVWDPFCNTGALLVETLGIVLGQPPGDPMKKYPFMNFPVHDQDAYNECIDSIELTPHRDLERLKLLGSDSNPRNVESAALNLRRFVRRLPQQREETGAPGGADINEVRESTSDDLDVLTSGLPCSVDVVPGTFVQIGRHLAGKPTMILTRIPPISALRDAPRGVGRWMSPLEVYAAFGRMLWRQGVDWRGVFCLVSDPLPFKDASGLEWRSEMKFLNGRRWEALLQWTGQAVGQRRKMPDQSESHHSRGRGRHHF